MIHSFLQSEMREYRVLLKKIPSLILVALVLTVVSMNMLANKELFRADWIALDCGFLLSWIPFLIMDTVCKVYGGSAAARLSILSIAINLILFGFFKLVSLTPGMWSAYYSTGSAEINAALNATIGGSSWIVLGSALALAVSSLANSVINSAVAGLLRKENFNSFLIRSSVSTAVSQFIDNLIFATVVSIPLFGWSVRQALICSATAATFELILEVCFSGFGYNLSKRLKSDAVL